DRASQQVIDRGRRLVELLKQRNGEPKRVDQQVVSIFAGTRGYLDDVPVVDISRFETELLSDVEARHTDVLEGIRKGGPLPEDELTKAVSDFKSRFVPSVTEED